MKNIVILITLLTTISVAAQDTIKYGDPRYLFNRRVNTLLNRNIYGVIDWGYAVDYDSINDTTGHPYTPIASVIGVGGRAVSIGYHTEGPIRIYGIAFNRFHTTRPPNIGDTCERVALLQYSKGTLKLLRVMETDNYARKSLFMFEGYYIYDVVGISWDEDQHPAIYHGRETALSHCYEYFFDCPASVHDTFFVYYEYSANSTTPLSYNIRHIPLYDSIGYPETPDDQFAERYCDMDLNANVYISDGEKYYIPQNGRLRDNRKFWGMAFPIIMPLDGADTLGEINPDSLWYNTPDSLGVTAIPAEPEVYLAPNPATGSTTLTTDVPVNRLLMYNVDGRLVLELSPDAAQVEINLAGLPKGLYIISAVTPQGTAHRKLIVR